jgi:hypothetical protein
MNLKLFDALIKKFSATTAFQVADIYEAFEELEVSLDKARNDPNLDNVVRVGANRALFILGKYYNKLDECEVYPIATSGYSSAADSCIIHPSLFMQSSHRQKRIAGLRRMPAGLMIGSVCSSKRSAIGGWQTTSQNQCRKPRQHLMRRLHMNLSDF